MDLQLVRHGNMLVGIDEENELKLRRLPADGVFNVKVPVMRNGRWFRKYFVLLKFGYEIWQESMSTGQEWRGHKVLASFDRFRKDIVILAGHYEPVYAYDGTLRLEPHSLRWDRMTEEEFGQLYSSTVDVLLQKVLARPDLTREKVDEAVNALLGGFT